tara:strand:+ start:6659 stop:7528 length:870 start_codon:yes stop_codon:yes gene_type:complete
MFGKWLSLSILVLLFGSAFSFIELSLERYSPSFIAFFRVFVAFIILSIICIKRNVKFDFVSDNFILLFILGLTGTTIPFLLISWGQLQLSSSYTGVLIGFMPLFTLLGSHYLNYEKLNLKKVIGFIIGFGGLVLLSFDSIINIQDNLVYFMSFLAIVLAAFFYATNALLVKKILHVGVLPLSAIVLFFSSIQLVFLLDINEFITLSKNIYAKESISLLVLSLFCTAIATLIYYKIIENYGPNFLSLVNYPVPVVAVIIGVIFLNEAFSYNLVFSLFLVLWGIFLSRKTS